MTVDSHSVQTEELNGHTMKKFLPDMTRILVLALIIRLYVLSLAVCQVGVAGIGKPVDDSHGYLQIAQFIMGDDTIDASLPLMHWSVGYGSFLAALFGFFGKNMLVVYLAQAVISSLSCALLYLLTQRLGAGRVAAVTAGLLGAVSTTSISLSLLVLSDTLYLFLAIVGFLLAWVTIEKTSPVWPISLGVTLASATYVRSIGLFWPIALLLAITVSYFLGKKFTASWLPRISRGAVVRVGASCAIALTLSSVWIVRNYREYSTFAFSSTSAIGISKVAMITLEREAHMTRAQIVAEWERDFVRPHPERPFTLAEHISLLHSKGVEVVCARPIEAFETYCYLVWQNMTAVDFLPRYVVPELRWWVISWEGIQVKYGLFLAHIGFALLGLSILFWQRSGTAFLLLFSMSLYYSIFVGFSQFAGSRIFHPALIAWAPLCGVCVAELFRGACQLWRYVRPKRVPN